MMKSTKQYVYVLASLIFFACGMIAAAGSMGTAFTYQGRLLNDNEPADGLYDIQFTLYDDPNGLPENQIGSTQLTDDIDVADGYFIAHLDFGDDIFDGNARWLQIAVRPGESIEPNDFNALNPLQPIIPSPYALHAQTVSVPLELSFDAPMGTAVMGVGSTGQGAAFGASSRDGDIAVLGKNSTAVWGISPAGFAGFFDGKGYFSGDVGIGTDTPSEKLTVSMGTGHGDIASFWSGNNNRFMISTDGVDSSLIAQSGNNLQLGTFFSGTSMTILNSNGNVGIGTTNPLRPLHSIGAIATGWAGANAPGTVTFFPPDAGAWFHIDNGPAGGRPTGRLRISGGNNPGDLEYMSILQDGKIGIGTTSPSEKLEVDGTVKATAFIGDGSGLTGLPGGGDADWAISGSDMYSAVSGNVGIGKTSPTAKLDIDGNIRATGTLNQDYDLAIATENDAEVGIGTTAHYDRKLNIQTSSDEYGLYANNSSPSGHRYGAYTRTSGNTTGYSYGLYGRSSSATGPNYGVYGSANTNSSGTNYGVYGAAINQGSNPNYGGYFLALGPVGRGIYAKGGSSGYAAEFAGNVIITNPAGTTTLMELGEGLDYAEGFDVSEENQISPGTVLVIDPAQAGKLTLSTQAYDSKVAGIVAGANGLGSGVRLGVGQFDCDVALAGRVYRNVDAAKGQISPGDLLTTSAKPGYAMKACDDEKSRGAILGKAMEPLEKGKQAQILVLVTLQ